MNWKIFKEERNSILKSFYIFELKRGTELCAALVLIIDFRIDFRVFEKVFESWNNSNVRFDIYPFSFSR